MKTVFSPIVEKADGYIVWENANYVAFLTPYPNTPGLTIVIPKHNMSDYVFNLHDNDYQELMSATKEVAHILERALGVSRVALIFEGTGVPHVHAKLYPLYGEQAVRTGVWSDHVEYSEVYRKYLTTVEGPKMSKKELEKIQKKILDAQALK